MSAPKKLPNNKLHEIACVAAPQFNQLLTKSAYSRPKLVALKRLKNLLASTIAGTYEYEVAITHIDSAERYLKSGEIGAAQFEVRKLLVGLKCEDFIGEEALTAQNQLKLESIPIIAAVKKVANKTDNRQRTD